MPLFYKHQLSVFDSMYHFWKPVIQPLLETMRPKRILEIGADEGIHSRVLAEYCLEQGAVFHIIEPMPRFDPEALGSPDRVVFHRDLSLRVLPHLPPVDVALVDGDHNWYTVINELRLLRRTAHESGRLTPVIACHDGCWPYARRDLYYGPETIPDECRLPWERAGMVRGQDELAPDSGLNARLCNAISEGGPQNGVLTAIEDFLSDTAESIELTLIPASYGLAILAPRSRLDVHEGLETLISTWTTDEGFLDIQHQLEEHTAETVV